MKESDKATETEGKSHGKKNRCKQRGMKVKKEKKSENEESQTSNLLQVQQDMMT